MLRDQPIEPQQAAAVAPAAGDFQHRQLAAQIAEADPAAVAHGDPYAARALGEAPRYQGGRQAAAGLSSNAISSASTLALASRERAKRCGVKLGRKLKLTPEQHCEAIKRRDGGEETRHIVG